MHCFGFRKPHLYKTEFCRSIEETGYCKYRDRCQFAHSMQELREATRHPRYKTQICKTFWEEGHCPYGKRCCFIHNPQDSVMAELRSGAKSDGVSPSLPSVDFLFSASSSEEDLEALCHSNSFEERSCCDRAEDSSDEEYLAWLPNYLIRQITADYE